MNTYSPADNNMFDDKAEFSSPSENQNPSVQEMLKHMFMVLIEYDKAMSQGQDAAVNPMSGRILMTLENGQTVEIPESIQKLAIVKFLEMQNSPKNVNNMMQQVQNIVLPKKSKKNIKKIIMYAVLIIIIIYMIYTYIHKQNDEIVIDF